MAKFILSVDDDADDRQMLRDALAMLDVPVQIREAQDGNDCLEQLHAYASEGALPCLVILDINMPRMDGRRTFQAIKSDPLLSSIPVVIFSTSTSPLDRLFFTSRSAAYFVKPVSVKSLLEVVRQMLDYCN
ncbi:MAG TPA: response regulator [Chitinophagaceae bacterium]|jgi:CheY-like chemotaxis protein|nr:response regulator [Chitinophagaceae bacterium]